MEIATRDKSVISALYTEVTKNLEASKLILSQQTPVIQILDTPVLPLIDQRKSFAVIIIMSFVISFIISMILLVVEFLFLARSQVTEPI